MFSSKCLLLTQSGHSTASIAASRKAHSITSSAEACSGSAMQWLLPSVLGVAHRKIMTTRSGSFQASRRPLNDRSAAYFCLEGIAENLARGRPLAFGSR